MKLTRIVTLLLICVGLGGCDTTTTNTVPKQLVGVWNTNAPKYTDRYFELKQDTVTFGMGNAKVTPNPVVKVTEKRGEKRSLYEISYLGQEGKSEKFIFYFEPLTASIRIKSQEKMIWTKGQAGAPVGLASASIPAVAPGASKPVPVMPATLPKNSSAGLPYEWPDPMRTKESKSGSESMTRSEFLALYEPDSTRTPERPVLRAAEPGLPVSQTILLGVAPTGKGKVAMMGGLNGHIYFLYANDPVENGRVARITDDSIVFEQKVLDSEGQARTSEVIKHLDADD